jgi:hypothetical protein
MQDNGKGMPHDDIPNMLGRGQYVIERCAYLDSDI